MEILDRRTVAVKFPMGKLFKHTIEKVNLGNDLTLAAAKLKIKVHWEQRTYVVVRRVVVGVNIGWSHVPSDKRTTLK